MERRTVFIVIGIVLLIAGAVGFSLFSKEPRVSVSRAEFSSCNLTAIGLNITLTMDSSYPVAIPVQKVDYLVIYKGKESRVTLASGEQYGIILKPGTQEISIPVLISNPAIITSLLDVLSTGQIDLSISGNVTPDFYGIAPAIPFHKEIITPFQADRFLSEIGSTAGKMLAKKILGF
jgi:hypothetical protein